LEYNADLARDFIRRTFDIINQYDNLDIESKKYEVTLRVNCLLGLIIFTKARFYKDLSFKIPKKGKYYEVLIEKNNGEGSYVVEESDLGDAKIILHCLRNGLAHWMEREENSDNLKFESNEESEISRIIIKGTGSLDGGGYGVRLEIKKVPEGLDEFLNRIHENILKDNYVKG